MPDKLALVFGNRKSTWAQLNNRTARLAGGLQAEGFVAGDRIALLAENSLRYVELLFAASWFGAVAVPLNHRLSDKELAVILEDCGACALFTDETSSERAIFLQRSLGHPCRLFWAGEGSGPEGVKSCDELVAASKPVEPAGAVGDDLFGIFYTGGTTGRPKGVMLTHTNLWMSAFSYCSVMGLSQTTVSLCSAPLFHVAAIAAAIPALLMGGAVVILPRFDAAAVFSAIAEHRVTVANFVPAMLRMLLDQPEAIREQMKSLDTLIYGAAPAPSALIDEVLETFPYLKLCHAYGMTELCGCISILPWQYNTAERRGEGRWRSAGHVIPGAEIRIVNASGNGVPHGEVGEICARGSVVMRGYWNQPEATSEALRDGWLHTGDAGFMDDQGFVYVVDRIKDMIISGGENIYCAEVEATISLLSSVHQCAVFGVPDAKWGEVVHAVIVPKPGAVLEQEDVVRHCRSLIAGYKVPRSVEFRREPLPLSGANKVLKRTLREEYLSGRAGVG